MLSQPDRNLVQRDKSIPGLKTLLDSELLLKRLRLSLPKADLRAVQPRYIRYKPGMNCLVAYRLNAGGKWIDVYAKAHGADAVGKLRKAGAKQTTGPFGPGRVALKGCDVVVSFFPNDSKLKRLRRIVNDRFTTKLMARLSLEAPGTGEIHLTPLRYKPERRFVARLEINKKPVALLKMYTRDAFIRSQASTNSIESRGMLRISGRLGKFDRYQLLGFEWLPGKLLTDMIYKNDNAIQAVSETGVALANFHLQRPRGLYMRTRAMRAETLLSRAEWLGYVCPALSEQAKQLAWKLSAWIMSQPEAQYPIHGDFYSQQVLWSKGRVGVIDLDETVMGDSCVDVGLFAAHLERDVLRGDISAASRENFKNAFVEGYRQGGGEVDETNLQMCIAAELFQLSHGPFRACEPDWAARTKAILHRAAALVRSTKPKKKAAPGRPPVTHSPKSSTTALVIDPFNVTKDDAMPTLKHALAPHTAEQLLKRMLANGEPGTGSENQLVAIRAIRYKPGRRCLVEYTLAQNTGDGAQKLITFLGKTRAKRMDTRTFLLNRELWQSGFHHQSIDNISVPRPVGIIPEFKMWFQEKVSGVLATHLIEKENDPGLARRIAEAIHKVHRLTLAPRRRHTMRDELRILHERLPLLTESYPQWTHRLEKILDACDRIGATVTAVEPTCIHRDFYPDQVLVSGDWLYLIDFDLFCLGDPALDAGNFLGHVTEQSLRNLGNPAALAAWENAFVEHFVDLNGDNLRHNIQVYKILTLARHIYISTLFPERRLFTEQLINLCERQLARAISNPKDRVMLMQA